MERLEAEKRLKTLLSFVGQQGASDLHLVIGRHPTLRVNGKLIPLTKEIWLSQLLAETIPFRYPPNP